MFAKILIVVVTFAKPIVVIVIVQPAYCCYCSTHKTTRNRQPKTHFFADFAIFLDFNMMLSDVETISGHFERLGHHFLYGSLRICHPSGPNVGDWEPSVSLVLLTRPSVGQC